MNGYPSGFNHLIYIVLAVLFLSGLALAPNALDMRLALELGLLLFDGETRGWMAAAHAASVFLTLMLIGALWTVHIRAGWVRRENVVAGVLLLVAFGLLAVSGLMLYYADEFAGQIALGLHLLAGLPLPAWLAAHLIGARNARRRCGLRQP